MKLIISCIEYRVTIPDRWTVVFTTAQPIGNRPSRFMIYKPSDTVTWHFQPVEGWGDHPLTHITKAYQWVKDHIGGDFDKEPKIFDEATAKDYL